MIDPCEMGAANRPDVQAIGAELLALRQMIDPLDDSFRVLGAPTRQLPVMTPDWLAQMQNRLRKSHVALARAGRNSRDINLGVARHLARDIRQRLSMALWATFVSGYDHSPLGRVTGLFPSLPLSTMQDEAYLLDAIAAIGPYISGCHAASVRAAAGRPPLARSIDQAVTRWHALLACDGRSLAPESATQVQQDRIAAQFVRHAAAPIQAYADWLATDARAAARSDTQPGLCHISGGIADYAALVATHTDNFGTVEDIHAFGLSEMARLHDTLAALEGKTIDTPIPDLLVATESDPTYGSATRFKAEIRHLLTRAETDFTDIVDLNNVDPLEIVQIPAHLCAVSPPAYYVPGSLGRRGTLMINADSMADKSVGSVDAMVYHEAIPGHHLQFDIAGKLDLPDFRKSAWLNAYIEGWGLYCEELAAEKGFYRTRAALRSKLAMELLRAARLVVDTGLHGLGWSVARATAYMMEAAGLSAQSAEAEVMRYIEYPAQALSYATGKARFLGIRIAVKRALGPGFDEKRFHYEMLRHGPVPLDILQDHVLAVLVEDARKGSALQ